MREQIKFYRLTLGVLLFIASLGIRAETHEIRVSRGFGILYLPLIVMQDQKLFEKQAAKAGLGNVSVKWVSLDGGNIINDAMMVGGIDFAATGVPGFLTLWAKSRGIPKIELVGVSGLSTMSLWLNSNQPQIKSLRDFSAKDKIALPGIKTSLVAVVLQMSVAKFFGLEHFAKLDPMTVSIPHADAVAALQSGKSGITAHFASPPYSYLELQDPNIHRVLSSVDVIGNITMNVIFSHKSFVRTNPKTTEIFLRSLDEANNYIARNKRSAAEIFVRGSNIKLNTVDVMTILNDPDTRFSTTPTRVMDFADFMHSVGSIKVKPTNWEEIFIPSLRGRAGS